MSLKFGYILAYVTTEGQVPTLTAVLVPKITLAARHMGVSRCFGGALYLKKVSS